jgi:MFS family permease
MLPLVPRLGTRRTMLTGAVLTVVGLLGGTQLASFPGLLALWVVLGLGSGLALTPASVVLRQHVRAEDRPLLYATYFSMTNIALLLAYPLAGWIGPALGLKAGFILLALAAAVAVFAALRLARPGRKTSRQET